MDELYEDGGANKMEEQVEDGRGTRRWSSKVKMKEQYEDQRAIRR